ncbi:MAG: NUDIX hydrolase [Thermosphaera sp.]
MIPIPSVGGILIEDSSILLVKRKNHPCKGFWSIPGGRQKHGETAVDAVKREILEETGLSVEPTGIYGIVELIPRVKEQPHYVIIEFLLQRIGGSLRPGSDAEEVGFFQLTRLPDNTGRATRELASDILRRINTGDTYLHSYCRYMVFEIDSLC